MVAHCECQQNRTSLHLALQSTAISVLARPESKRLYSWNFVSDKDLQSEEARKCSNFPKLRFNLSLLHAKPFWVVLDPLASDYQFLLL